MKLNVWASGAGILALLFYLAGAVGGFFSGYFFWLSEYNTYLGSGAETILLIFTILMFAVAGFCAIALLLSIFGIPKALWVILAFLSLACAVVPAILLIALPDLVTFYGLTGFPYFDLTWYQSHMWDFIGFWLAAGGSLLAFLLGIFIPRKS